MKENAVTKWARSGLTLVEVIVALGILSVGIVAIYGMQMISLRGNMEAQDMTSASHLAESWLENMRLDGVEWNHSQPDDLGDTLYLNQIKTNPNVWIVANDGKPFNRMGQPIDPDDESLPDYFKDNGKYCIHYRLDWVLPNSLMRADVRVLWPRQSADQTYYSSCGSSAPEEMAADDIRIHSVVLTTTISQNRIFR